MLKLTELLQTNLKQPLKAVIGIDPASGCTGWSLLVIDGDQTLHVIDCGVIKPPDSLEQNEQMSYIYYKTVETILPLMQAAKSNGIEVLGYGIEIPAVLLGGKQRMSRDIVQIQAIGVIRAAMSGKTYKEVIVRPNQVHAQVGANSINYFKQVKADLKAQGYKAEKVQAEVKKIKKNMVKDWVVKNCILNCSMKTFDESDAIIISVIGYYTLANIEKKRRRKC